MEPDERVIQSVLLGASDRYGELVDRYQLAAWKLAYSFVGDFEEARDLSQNGFVKAYQNLGRFRGGSRFSTWLYRIVANECKDFLRRKNRRPFFVSLSAPDEPEEGASPAIPFELEDRGSNPREAAQDRELAAQLARAVERLPMKQRTAFLLRHVNGLSLEETSEAMGCRLGTVKSHLFRASESLRSFMGPFITSQETQR